MCGHPEPRKFRFALTLPANPVELAGLVDNREI